MAEVVEAEAGQLRAANGRAEDAVAEVVLRVIAAGAVGINLEDYVPGATDLEPMALQVDKITTIIKALKKAGMRVVINARTDVFLRALGASDARLSVAINCAPSPSFRPASSKRLAS